MRPDIWGPMTWTLLHSITLEYPDTPTEENKTNIKNFISSFGKVLPCEKCRINFDSHLIDLPLTDTVLSSKKNFIKWMIDVHNSVNKMNGKKELSYHEALKIILTPYSTNNGNNNSKNIIIIVLTIVIVILIVILLYRTFF